MKMKLGFFLCSTERSHSLSIKRQCSGFSLTELIVVIAIIGIMMAIALPSYQNHIVESRRKAAQGCLMELAQFMERYYTTNMTYVGAALPTTQCRTDLTASYTFSLTAGASAATQYTLNAIPVAGSVQATRDATCGTLTINQAGTRGAGGTNCWL